MGKRTAVFVDNLFPTIQTKRWPFREASHLMVRAGTDLQILNDFARRLGLKEDWLQTSANGVPHYDLTRGKHFQAIRMGAKLVDRRFVADEIIAGWRAISEDDE